MPSINPNPDSYSLDLAAELPDLFDQMFLQLGQPLEEFTFFPELPLEIRLTIWRFTFPRGRHVNLDFVVGKELYYSSYSSRDNRRMLGIEEHCPLPVALRVDRESRIETLKHYCLLHRPQDVDMPFQKRRARPFCYNPELDTGFVCEDSLWDWSPGPRKPSFLSALDESAPQIVAAIRSLEVRGLHWNLSFCSRLRRVYQGEQPVKLGILFDMPHLQEVKIVLREDIGTRDVPRIDIDFSLPEAADPNYAMEGNKQMVDEISEVFNVYKDGSKWKGAVPTVLIKPWSKLQA